MTLPKTASHIEQSKDKDGNPVDRFYLYVTNWAVVTSNDEKCEVHLAMYGIPDRAVAIKMRNRLRRMVLKFQSELTAVRKEYGVDA